MAGNESLPIRFDVKLFNVRGHDLKPMDKCGTSDPYFYGDFAGFKTFQSEYIKKNCNPEWKYTAEFDYRSKYINPKELATKNFTLEVWDHDRVGSNNYIGECSVDLLTLFTGPVHYTLELKALKDIRGKRRLADDQPEITGRVSFDITAVQMCQVAVTPGHFHFDQPSDTNVIVFSYDFGEKRKGSVEKPTKSGEWENFDILLFEASLVELNSGVLGVAVFEGKEVKKESVPVRTITVNFADFLFKGLTCKVQVNRDGLSGEISLKNPPIYSQFSSGEYNINTFTNCTKAVNFPQLPVPPNFNSNQSTQPQQSQQSTQQSQQPQQPQEAPRSTPAIDSLSRLRNAAYGGIATQSLASSFQGQQPQAQQQPQYPQAPQQGEEVLPPGWKLMFDPERSAKFYFNEATGESSWTLPQGAGQPAAPAAQAAQAAAPGSPTMGSRSPTQQQQQDPNALPPGFVERLDGSGRPYYVNVATGMSQWERPTNNPQAAAPGPAAGGMYPSLAPQQSGYLNYPQQPQQPQQQPYGGYPGYPQQQPYGGYPQQQPYGGYPGGGYYRGY